MRYWLMKSEPDEFSIDDLAAAKGRTTPWFGVRNYQARNFMRDEMKLDDLVLFYHSSCPEPGIAGIASSASTPAPRLKMALLRGFCAASATRRSAGGFHTSA